MKGWKTHTWFFALNTHVYVKPTYQFSQLKQLFKNNATTLTLLCAEQLFIVSPLHNLQSGPQIHSECFRNNHRPLLKILESSFVWISKN